MKRTTSDEERKLFRDYQAEARPIRVFAPQTAAKKKTGGPGGVNGTTAERLRKGQMEPEARIDLHGKTEGAAHRALTSFITNAHARGARLVLVITGKGNPNRDETAAWMMHPHGVLKQMTPRWLNQPELKALIAHVGPSHVRHGGDGALYVYLRKNR